MKKRSTSVLLCSLFVATTSAVVAEELSLEGALAMARQANPALQAVQRQAEAAAAEVDVARAELYPTLSARLSYADYSGDVFYNRFVSPAPGVPPDPNAPGTPVDDLSTTNAALLVLTQTLYSGGANGARVRAGQVEQQLAQNTVERDWRELAAQVERAYYDVLLAQQASTVSRASVERSRAALAAVEKRRQEEEALEVEALAARAQLDADELAQLRADNDARFARYELNRLLGRDPETDVTLTGDLATAGPAMDEAAVLQAVGEHPSLAEARLQIELADELADLARAAYRPKLQLEGYYASLDNEMFFDGSYFGADVAVSVPFVRDVVLGRAGVRQAEAQRLAGEQALAATEAGLRLQARQAVRAADEARRAAEVARRAVDYHREKQRVTATAFGETLATSEDLAKANAELAEAELTLHGALHRARLADSELRRLAGGGGAAGAGPSR